MKKNNIKVEIDSPFTETVIAMELIKKFLQKNKIQLELSIAYDFNADFAGLFMPNEHKDKHFARIYINPNKCKSFQESQTEEFEEPFAPGYCVDLTMFGIILHEFSHVLQFKVYREILDDFAEAFPTERFNLSNYCNNEIHDELAEVMEFYISNPYLLRLVSKPHFDFCKKYFKSPVACTIQRCYTIYHGFPFYVKQDLKEKWGIVFNIKTNEFQRR